MNMNRHTEQEWQFAAQDLDSARHWLATQPQEASERHCASRPTVTMQDTYYDSADWMIFRAGFALRVRQAQAADDSDHEADNNSGTEITLKSLHKPQDGLARRTEISEQVGSANLAEVLERDNGIGGRIRELVGSRPLAPLFHARTRRERQQLLEADSDLPLAEIDLDETSIEAPSGQARELRRVEVECIHADPGAVSPWVDQLREAAQLQPVEVSKFRAGLEVAGLTPSTPESLGSTGITASQPFAATQLATLRRYFALMLDKEAEVRVGSPTAVHEMRVAARHLDVLLRVFRGYGPTWAVSSRGRVRGLIKALGAVRDCDVQLAFLEKTMASLDAEKRGDFEPVRVRLDEQRSKARSRLLQTLDSPPVRAFIREWREHLTAAKPGSTRAQRRVTAGIARDLIREQSRKLRKRASRLDEDAAADDFHEVRIRAKRLRYTLDAFASLYGNAAKDYIGALAKLQGVLGEYHDSKVREQRFAELVSRGPRLPSATSFMVGRLVERDASAAERCRKAFSKAYRRVRGRRWRELVVVMKRQQETATPAADTLPGK
jgi:CHAD domain-containing protein